jgi:unsaturated rhamnogalacturonyl hydrolase
MKSSGFLRAAARFASGVGAAALLALCATAALAAEIEPIEIGLTAGKVLIGGMRVAAARTNGPTVALVGGLAGDDASSRAIRDFVTSYAAKDDAERPFTLVAIPVGNPRKNALDFPPAGAAYREDAESYALWRWLGLNAPDLVLVAGDDKAGLATALASEDVAGVAPIAARGDTDATKLLENLARISGRSRAHEEIDRRRARTPEQLAELLAPIYGQTFDTPWYLYGMGLIAHLEIGDLDLVERLAEPYVDGTKDSLQAGPNGVSTLVLAGHLVFAELAERTGDPRYLERAKAAADTCFNENGEMLEAVPNHGEMSDAIFMGASILAAVGELTGETRYFDMAARQIAFMNKLVLRDDGLYRHSPLTDAAWGRGNGFAAIGYALTLSKMPKDHPAYAKLMSEYVALMRTLARWQNEDGTWRQVIDYPGAYHETSGTAIIGFSMQRGLNRGWLDPAEFEDHAARAFTAVSTRTDDKGGFIDVSESTNKQPSVDAYLEREAVAGQDQRTGSFAMLFAVEREGAGK